MMRDVLGRSLGAQKFMVALLGLFAGCAVTLALLLTAAGLVMGLGGSWAATRLLEGALFGISRTDTATFVGVTLLLAGAVMFSCWLLARRAARVDPMVALRSE